MLRCVALAVLLVLSVAQSALAGTATMGEYVFDPTYPTGLPDFHFAATPGERNALTVTRDGLAITLRDARATVHAGPGCVAIDPRAVVCRPPGAGYEPSLARFVIDAGDGDDVVTLPAKPGPGFTGIQGGPGDDTLAGAGTLDGGPGRDVLTGGDGRDELDGGSGADVLRGGRGDDRLRGGGGDDRIDGGPGRDLLTYARERHGVRVDLDTGTAIRRDSERDRVAGIERVAGSSGPDSLSGDERDNELDGTFGGDVLDGRGGDDSLHGGEGTDVLRGGDGRDLLSSGDASDTLLGGRGDDTLRAASSRSRPERRFRCGSGRDRVEGDPRGGLLVDCEQVDPAGGSFSARPLRNGSVRVDFACTALFLERCSVTASLRRGSARVATGSGTSSTYARRAFVLRPRQRLRRGDVVEVVASGSSRARGEMRRSFGARWRIRL